MFTQILFYSLIGLLYMQTLIYNFANENDLDADFLNAILCVETSGGSAFGYKHYPVMRFELNEFIKRVPEDLASQVPHYFGFGTKKNLHQYYIFGGIRTHIHSTQENEFIAFTIARTIDETSAFESTSYGVAQIMGFNYKRVGYLSAKEMYEAAFVEENQYKMFFAFLKSNSDLIKSVRDKDIDSFIKMYNGVGLESLYKNKFNNCMDKIKSSS